MQLQRKPRPKFAQWRFEHGLGIRQTADLLEGAVGYRVCSYEKVRTICLPFGDPERTEVDLELGQAIAVLTRGEISLADFAPAAQQPA